MRRIFFLMLVLPFLGMGQKACPDCYGYGSNATGGRGGVLVIITTLDETTPLTYYAASGNDAARYEGGLNAALEQSDVGPIVSEVSGNIELERGNGSYSGYRRTYGEQGMPNVANKTIFGQSAPLGGITIYGGSFAFNQASNLIIMNLRSRHIYNKNNIVDTSDDLNSWALLFRGGEDIYVSQFSASFSQDKNLGGYINEFDAPGEFLRNITIDKSLIADGNTNYYFEINPGRPNSPEDNTYNISICRTASGSANRNPNLAFNGRADVDNNVTKDARVRIINTYHDIRLNHRNNWNGSFSSTYGLNMIQAGYDTQIFSNGNVGMFSRAGTGDLDENDDQKAFWAEDPGFTTPAPADNFVGSAFTGTPNPLPLVSASAIYTELITNKNVGAYQYMDDNGYLQQYNDPFDDGWLNDMQNDVNYDEHNASNWVLPSIPSNTRPASYDTDRDGMSDAWEIREFGNITAYSYNDDPDGDGYTNIEEFMYGTDPGGVSQQPKIIKSTHIRGPGGSFYKIKTN